MRILIKVPRITASLLLALNLTTAQAAESIVVGSKTFAESYLLAEIMAQTLERAGYSVDRRFGFGGTLICFEALRRGEIDIYPEYTGTISQVILKHEDEPPLPELNQRLTPLGLEALGSFGFNNTYALVVSEQAATRLGLDSIADLAGHDDLILGFSHEFLNRQDGWPGLADAYGLRNRTLGIEHGLAYQALIEEDIDVTDAYSTDGDLLRYPLRVLQDELRYFPEYLAVPFVRASLDPGVKSALGELTGLIDEDRMRNLNAQIVIDERSFAQVAGEFIGREPEGTAEAGIWRDLLRNTLTHLKLTGIALALACLAGLTAAILVYPHRRLSAGFLYTAGLLQTIPSIALLALLIPLAGVGEVPAIIALFLYSLLPILRNAITALRTIDPLLRRVAAAMGMTGGQQIRFVFLPLALPHVLAGIRTAAVISIGTATLAAFIGAGGLGEPIVTGLNLNDPSLILQGAIPAALLALLTELAFELLERWLVPAHMLSTRIGQ